VTREQRLESWLKVVLEENDHNVSTKGLISTLKWDTAAEIVKELATPKPKCTCERALDGGMMPRPAGLPTAIQRVDMDCEIHGEVAAAIPDEYRVPK
jgi:hypothetical protein